MAPNTAASQTQSVQTLPRLLAINKELTGLDEQIDQATQIIGLPKDWATIQEEKARSEIIQKLVRSRAEWVLRWILEKLKGDAETSAQARKNARAWKLLDWMVQVLPTSRSAALLRDADFLSTLERTLHENFEKESINSTAQESPDSNNKDNSESSETVRASPVASRKRKRPSSGTDSPAKRVALSPGGLEPLFGAVVNILTSISKKARSQEGSDDVQREHMKMALRTESAQAARILKGWLSAVTKVLSNAVEVGAGLLDSYLDLSLVLEIWELRMTDGDDSAGASAEQFSTECLLPLLVLYDALQDETRIQSSGQPTTIVLRGAVESLERLLARHLFAPARAAFFANAAAQTDATDKSEPVKAEELATNLEPLRAKILLAAQIQDASVPIPKSFTSLFDSIPKLLDMAIRISPSRTPRSRVAERPWLQAAFVALAECAGCSLEVPKFLVPNASMDALEKLINVLALHEIKVDSNLLADVFWFHSGVKFPLNQKKNVCWSLIAALIKLNPDTFFGSSRSSSTTQTERPQDLTEFLFGQISLLNSASASKNPDEIDVEMEDASVKSSQPEYSDSREDVIITSVITPLMSAFARNRDLLGFIHRWDVQLCENARVRGPFNEVAPTVWDDRRLGLELARLLEQSLTESQIVKLFQLHTSRVKPAKESDRVAMEQAYGSAVLLRSLLWSIKSDETVQALEPQLSSLLSLFTDLVRDDWYRKHTDSSSCWITLCRLLVILWPLGLHTSLDSQKELVEPILKQATKDIGVTRKESGDQPIDPKTRAAALLFVLTACDHLRTVPGWDETLVESVRKALKTLSTSKLGVAEFPVMVEIFCTDFPQLLEYLEPEARKESLLRLLGKIADGLSPQTLSHAVDTLSLFVFSSGSSGLRDTYSAALLDTMYDVPDASAEKALLYVRPLALSRERREAILDKATEMLISKPANLDLNLSLMNELQEVPNATAKIASDGRVFFDIAQSLDNHKVSSPSTIQLFQQLVRKTLTHMLPNKDQTQNQKYLEKFQKKLKSLLKKPEDCSAPKYAILRAAMRAQKDEELISWDKYVALLAACLPNSLGSESGSHMSTILTTFMELPTEPVEDYEEMFEAAQTALRKCFGTAVSTGEYLNELSTSAQFHALVAKYRLYDDITSFIDSSRRLLRQTDRKDQGAVLKAVGMALSSLSQEERLDLVPVLIDSGAHGDQSASYQVLYVLSTTLDDKSHEDAEQRIQQLAFLPTVCTLLSTSSTSSSFSALMDTVDTLIRDKPSFTSQHSIECVLTALVKLSSRNSPALSTSDAPAIYTRLCETTRSILLLHRSRLGGRFHLLLPLLQNLLFCLYIPHAGRYNTLPEWLRPTSTSAQVKLTPTNAGQFSRILSTLCSPTLSSVSKSHLHRTISKKDSKSTLNDPVKAAREYVAHHVYPLLASLCRYQLNGRLDTGVREKLLPGLWEVVGTAGLDKDNLQAMYAGLDRSSREIWKGVWEEWRKVDGRGTREVYVKDKEA